MLHPVSVKKLWDQVRIRTRTATVVPNVSLWSGLISVVVFSADPTVNFVSLTVLGLRLLFLKTVVFNVLMTFRLWISQCEYTSWFKIRQDTTWDKRRVWNHRERRRVSSVNLRPVQVRFIKHFFMFYFVETLQTFNGRKARDDGFTRRFSDRVGGTESSLRLSDVCMLYINCVNITSPSWNVCCWFWWMNFDASCCVWQ